MYFASWEKEFFEFTKLGYKGLEEVRVIYLDYWSYFKFLSGLKDLDYLTIQSLWYYDEMEFNKIVLLKDDLGTRRMKII